MEMLLPGLLRLRSGETYKSEPGWVWCGVEWIVTAVNVTALAVITVDLNVTIYQCLMPHARLSTRTQLALSVISNASLQSPKLCRILLRGYSCRSGVSAFCIKFIFM
ncbi:hypothetical protein PoB_002379700 [Plakobranchus ocellatus]|uniref:G-protein coupled receptors family 1 profile domain-containing protein n=1 Tax=Plakobranchus ocellatus TaxID=259542 RepID=A0AAV3ZQ22_9GAST|nr:hypothetical protein PoB_002379700 [Plakobranchus ocellatus]